MIEYNSMEFAIRPMLIEDIPQVTAIDREVFPTLQPVISFHYELRHNKIARYFIAYSVDGNSEQNKTYVNDNNGAHSNSLVKRISLKIKRFFGSPPATSQLIVGFAAVWFIADEAHLTTIAVRKAYQRQGIGELLLTHAFDISIDFRAKFMTLEVRMSNLIAQSLYEKYGFCKTGERLGYYSDTKEDAVIMSTDPIMSDSFQNSFQRLKGILTQKMC